MDEAVENHIRSLRYNVRRLRSVLKAALEDKNAYDERFCRWCWKLDGAHAPGCWIQLAENALKETGG